MKLVNDFFEYKILAMNDKNKIEDWNGIVLKRPDPQIIWNDEENIKNIDAIYTRSNKGGGSWNI